MVSDYKAFSSSVTISRRSTNQLEGQETEKKFQVIIMYRAGLAPSINRVLELLQMAGYDTGMFHEYMARALRAEVEENLPLAQGKANAPFRGGGLDDPGGVLQRPQRSYQPRFPPSLLPASLWNTMEYNLEQLTKHARPIASGSLRCISTCMGRIGVSNVNSKAINKRPVAISSSSVKSAGTA